MKALFLKDDDGVFILGYHREDNGAVGIYVYTLAQARFSRTDRGGMAAACGHSRDRHWRARSSRVGSETTSARAAWTLGSGQCSHRSWAEETGLRITPAKGPIFTGAPQPVKTKL